MRAIRTEGVGYRVWGVKGTKFSTNSHPTLHIQHPNTQHPNTQHPTPQTQLMRSFPLLTLLVLLLGGAIAPAALALPNRMPIVVAERQRGDIFRELNLSPEQTRQIQAIRDRYQGQLEQHKRAMRQEQQQLRSLMAGNASTEQIREQFRQLQAARQTLSEVQFNSFLEIRAVLTPQQRRKFAEIMGNRR